jgi:hypothetical protein
MGTDIEWRWADPSGQQRRVRTDELRAALASGVIAPNTPVWRKGWTEWQPADSVPELTTSALAAAQGLVMNIPPPPLAVVAVQAQMEAEAIGAAGAESEAEPPPPPPYVPAPVATPIGAQHPVAPKSVRPPPKSIKPPAAPTSSSRAVDEAAKKLGPSLPTTMGVPALSTSGHAEMPLSPITTPVPEAAVAPAKGGVAAKGGRAATIQIHGAPPPARPSADQPAPPINVPPPSTRTPQVAPENIEELSGSAIIPESFPDLAAAPNVVPAAGAAPASQPMPAPKAPGGTILGMTAPTMQEARAAAEPAGDVRSPFSLMPGDDTEPQPMPSDPGADAGIPKGLRQILHDMRKLQPKNKFFLPVAGGVGALAFLILIGLVIRACTKKDDDVPKPVASASASVMPSAIASSRRPVDVPPPPPVTSSQTAGAPTGGACTLAGAPKVISPRAVPQVGIEVVPHGSNLALGFAPTPKEGLAVQIDPSSLEVSQTAKIASKDPIKRVVPTSPNGKLSALTETDKRPKRTVWTDAPIDVGVVGGQVVASPFGSATFTKLFPIEGGDAPLDALRGVALDGKTLGKGYAIAFRRGGAIWMGAFSAEPIAAKGPLLRIQGQGPQVGQPAIAASGDAILVAWADRASATESWSIRWVRFTPGELAPTPKELAVPAGGLGGNVMAPSLAGLDGGRFLVAWTEGPATSHQIRALTIGADGQAIGEAIVVSPEGVNAGQGQAGILADGRGVVAYLGVTKAKTFEVVAVPIKCN